MNWLEVQKAVLDAATGAVEFAANWLLQSTLLIAAGLAIARLMRQPGSAAQSLVYRTTLAAVLLSPIATWSLSLAGVPGWFVELPDGWAYRQIEPSSTDVERSAPIASSGFAAPTPAPIVSPELSSSDDEAAMAPRGGSIAPTTIAADAIQTAKPRSVIAEPPVAESIETTPSEAPMLSIHRFGWAALGVAASWLLISVLLGARLASAWRRLARLRRRSSPADSEVVRHCHELASLLGIAAPDVVCNPYLPSPCLFGLRKPAVLLPDGELSLLLRDALIHELAHLKRRDCHWKLLREAATALFFFQPLLWRLSRRIEVTAEEVCDDYVIKYGGDRRAYAHRLVDVAELSSVPIAAAGVAVVSLRSMLARRVARIMDTSRSLSIRAGNLLLAAVLVGGGIGTTTAGLVGLRPRPSAAEVETLTIDATQGRRATSEVMPSNEPPAPARKKTAAAVDVNVSASGDARTEEKTEAADAAVPEDLPQRYEGKVVDPTGKPVEGAELYLVFHIPQPTGLLAPTWRPVATTDAAGAFRFTARPKEFGAHATAREFGYASLVAVKDGFGFAWSWAGQYEASGKWLRDARARMTEAPAEFLQHIKRMLSGAGQPLKLVIDDQPIRGRIVDINGQPVAGARLTLLEVWSGFGDDLAPWREAAKAPKADYYSARMKTPMSINGPQVRSLVKPAVTDAAGRFTLRGVGLGRIAELLIEGSGIESAKIFARTEAGEKIELLRERQSPDLGSYIYYSAELAHVARPSTAIAGVVRDAQTKAPLAGVTVKSQSRHGERISGWGQDFVRAVTDDKGRYRLEGMPIGDDNRIAAIAPIGDMPYLSMSKRAATSRQEHPLDIDFELRRGVWIEGRITDKQTGKGLPGTLACYVKKGNPSYQFARSLWVDQRDRLLSDDDGHFRIAALPGPGFVTFMADEHENYPRADAVVKLDGSREKVGASIVEAGVWPRNYHLVAEIDPSANAQRVELNLQLDGGASVIGRVVDPEDRPVAGCYYSGQLAEFASWRPSAGDKFELKGYDPESPRHVYFAHRERNLAASVIVKGKPPADLAVKLQPAGSVKGRLVDQDGAPLANFGLTQWYPSMRSPADIARAPHVPPLPPNVAHWQTGQYETDDEGRFEISCLAPGVEYRLRAFDRESMTPTAGRTPKFSGPLDVIIQVAPGESKDLGDVRLADESKFMDAAHAKSL